MKRHRSRAGADPAPLAGPSVVWPTSFLFILKQLASWTGVR